MTLDRPKTVMLNAERIGHEHQPFNDATHASAKRLQVPYNRRRSEFGLEQPSNFSFLLSDWSRDTGDDCIIK